MGTGEKAGASKVKVGIIGASGYTGAELLRLLAGHPAAEVCAVTSRVHAGQPVHKVFPGLRKAVDLAFLPTETPESMKGCDVVFTAVPNGVAVRFAPELLKQGARVIDLGADFRFRDPSVYTEWYNLEHPASFLLSEAVYGIPELKGKKIAAARLIGNPGCYPTSVILALAPLLAARAILLEEIIIDAKSGVSGAGHTPAQEFHFPECQENLRAYKVVGHRHTPEIEQEISELAGEKVLVSFTPHLVPMIRGILSTLHLKLRAPAKTGDLLALYREFYAGAYFVRVLGEEELPQTKAVQGTNFCDIGWRVDQRTGRLIVLSAIDNLVKGAAGQAIQNMNLIFGLPEKAGLEMPALWP
ncbi:MAG: N-acetyl-gamma-glutamyl-phosphate reductase [Firmicutes bacterium]|nr:N-acetyl-gamma-glutamyl-phosphate reductase [Bacillota bacterium]